MKAAHSAKTSFVPVWTTHNSFSEGGCKVHMMLAADFNRQGTIKVVCGRKVGLAAWGYAIDDLNKWQSGCDFEVCRTCAKRVRSGK